MRKNLYLIIGRSGTGKTTVVEELEKRYGYKSVQSYTTRPKRYENETGHTFITKEEFDKKKMLAYTKFNGYEYGVDADLLSQGDLYIIDIPGVKYLQQSNVLNKKLITINLRCNQADLIKNMINRGDSKDMIQSRLLNDDIMFADEKNFPFDYIISTDNCIEDKVNKIHKYIEIEETKN